MIILASTSDLVRVVTSSAANVDVQASWLDYAGGTPTPGVTDTLISSATTTTVVGSPASSTYRAVQGLRVRNRHATLSVDVSVVHSDGTNVPELIKVTLLADHSLQYEEGEGFAVHDGQGRLVERSDGIVPDSSWGMTTVILAADVANADATPNTIADVTGFSFAVTSGNTYYFRYAIWYTTVANATGSLWAINGPASPTFLSMRSEYTSTSTTRTTNEGVTAYDTPSTANTGSLAAGSHAIVEGIIKPSASGTVILRFASEITVSEVRAKAGSVLHWMQVI